MSDWNAAAADYLTELGRQPAAAPPATIGEIWQSEWTRSGLDTIGGIGKPFGDAYDELSRAIEKHGGADIGTLAFRSNVNMGAAVTPDLRVAALNAIADTLPEDARKELEPLRDVRRRASDKAQAIEREAADVAGRTYGLSGNAVAFLAGTARQFVDPEMLLANAITAPIGGPFKGPVLKVIARQGVAGAAAQLLVEPQIQEGRATLGLDSGFSHGAMDVAQAALGAGGLAALLRAGGAGYRFMRGPRAEVSARPMAEGAPNFEPTFLGHMDAEDVAAFDRGEILTRPHALSDIPNVPGFAGDLRIATGDEVADAKIRADIESAFVRARSKFEPPPSDFSATPHLSAEDVAAFDHGHAVERVTPAGDGAPSFGSFDIAEGAGARPTRSRAAPYEPGPSELRSAITADDVAAFDRGHALETPHALNTIEEGAWRPFDGLTAADLDAAARLVERDQLIDHAAPPSWDRATHHAMVDEAATALEAGRPIDRAAAAAKVEAAGLKKPELIPLEANAIAAAAEPTAPRFFGIHKTPEEKLSLFQFLASRGGVRLDDPLIADLIGSTGVNPFIPGYGQLIRKPGAISTAAARSGRSAAMTLDQAREAAALAGYLPEKSKVSDLLDLANLEAKGNKQYREGFTPEAKVNREQIKAELEQHRAGLATDFDTRLAQLEVTKITKRDRTRALQIMEKEGTADPLLAFEQALAEHEARQEAIRAKRLQDEKLHIPGWDVADDAGPAPGHGADVPGQPGDRPGERGPGGEPRPGGEGAGAAGEQGQLGEQSLGDPGLKADADRAIAQAGEDFNVTVTDQNGNTRRAKPAELIREAEEQAKASDELFDCAGGKPDSEEPPF